MPAAALLRARALPDAAMPVELHWEDRGVLRRYTGDVTIAERRASFDAICSSPRFGDLRYSITDYLPVRGYEIEPEATEEIAALHVAPLIVNPRILIAAVAVRDDILAAIGHFIDLGYTTQPYRVFATLQAAREWIAAPGVRWDATAQAWQRTDAAGR